MGNFDTARTRALRATELSDSEARTVGHIEDHGCSILSISPGDGSYSRDWSYTVGNYDVCRQPELIVVGLRPSTAQYLLNEACQRQRDGVDLAHGRHAGLLGEVDCEFRPVDPKWVAHLMHWANWYHAGNDFPVLQAIYPDLENRFPQDPGFDQTFAQPFLQPGIDFSHLEHDLWGSNDPDSSLYHWKFPDSPHTKAYLSAPVNAGLEPVTYVSHDADDGAWQFLGDSMTAGQLPVLVCLHHPIDRDRSLEQLADLPLGWYAERDDLNSPWRRQEHPPEEQAG